MNFKELKLNFTQGALLVGATVIAILAIALRFRGKQLARARLLLLKQHHDNELTRLTEQTELDMARANKSGDRFYEAFNSYSTRYGAPAPRSDESESE